MFATESDWFINNWDSVDYFKSSTKWSLPEVLTKCSSCGNPSHNPSSDHYFLEEARYNTEYMGPLIFRLIFKISKIFILAVAFSSI